MKFVDSKAFINWYDVHGDKDMLMRVNCVVTIISIVCAS